MTELAKEKVGIAPLRSLQSFHRQFRPVTMSATSFLPALPRRKGSSLDIIGSSAHCGGRS
jgi:hypothetical protein